MKQRLLVMNGQKIIENDKKGDWSTEKVMKAGDLKPGIYNLYNAKDADKSQQYNGIIIHNDKNKIYQQTKNKVVMHSTSNFDIVPIIGSAKSISYKDDKAIISQATLTKSRAR